MRAFLGIFCAFFTLILLFLQPLSNYYEAKYQKDFFLNDSQAMGFSRRFLSIANDQIQNAKIASWNFIDELYASFFSSSNLPADLPTDLSASKSEQKVDGNLTMTSKLERFLIDTAPAQDQNLSPNLTTNKDANLTAKLSMTPKIANTTNLNQHKKPIELNENLGVILIGDSIMQGFGWGFENMLKNKKIMIKNMAKASTGLVNKEFYDWSEQLDGALKNLQERPANLLILALFGANDAYSFSVDKKLFKFNTPEWSDKYQSRINEIYTIAKNHDAQVIWLAMPCMKSANFDKKMKTLNKIFKSAAEQNEAKFIDIGAAICENGKFMHAGSDKKALRNDDGIHISMTGAKKVAALVIEKLLVGE